MFDLSLGWTADDAALLAQIPDDLPRLLVGNKADLQPASMAASLGNQVDGKTVDVMLSALTGQGEEALIEAVLKTCGASEAQGLVVALNQRQRDLALAAAGALGRSQEAAEHQLPWDFGPLICGKRSAAWGKLLARRSQKLCLIESFRVCVLASRCQWKLTIVNS